MMVMYLNWIESHKINYIYYLLVFIADISHNRHKRQWRAFLTNLVYFFAWRTQNDGQFWRIYAVYSYQG